MQSGPCLNTQCLEICEAGKQSVGQRRDGIVGEFQVHEIDQAVKCTGRNCRQFVAIDGPSGTFIMCDFSLKARNTQHLQLPESAEQI